jgi:hypothetical protein
MGLSFLIYIESASTGGLITTGLAARSAQGPTQRQAPCTTAVGITRTERGSEHRRGEAGVAPRRGHPATALCATLAAR